MTLESTYLEIIAEDQILQNIYDKLKKEEKASATEISYLDDLIQRTADKEKKKCLCNFMFDVLNRARILRGIFDSCDDELHSFRFSRITNLDEDMRFVEQGVTVQTDPQKDEEIEFLDEETGEVIKFKRSELEKFDKEVRIDDWVEGELDLCFWAIGKYVELGLRGSFLEFLKLYLRRERFHFLFQWYYRELAKKIRRSEKGGRELWMYVYPASRFNRDYFGLLQIYDILSHSSELTVEEKYDLDILTFLDLKSEEELSDYLVRVESNVQSSGLFTPGQREYRIRIPVVIDTNIMVSALAHYSSSEKESLDVKLFRKWIRREIEVIVSPEILEEYETLLKREHENIEAKGIAFDWLNLLKASSCIVEPSINLEIIKEHPEDNRFLECAVAGKAKCILTRNKHLLKLGKYEGIEIVQPETFLRQHT